MTINKINSYIRRLLSIVVCLSVVFGTSIVAVADPSDLQTSTNSWQSKIDDELWEIMETKSDTDLIPVWLWLVDTVHEEDVMEIMRTEKGFNPDIYEHQDKIEAHVAAKIAKGEIALSTASASITTSSPAFKDAVMDEMDKYNTAWLDIVKSKHTAFNTAFVKEHIDTQNRTIHYFSTLTSTLIVDATKAEIIEYAKAEEVEGVSFAENKEVINESETPLNQIFADNTIGSQSSRYNSGTGYKGRGVKIGIIEAEGGCYDPESP